MARREPLTNDEDRLLGLIDLYNSDVERVWQEGERVHIELSYPIPDRKDEATLAKNPL